MFLAVGVPWMDRMLQVVLGVGLVATSVVAGLLFVRFVYHACCGTHRKHRVRHPRSGVEAELDAAVAKQDHLVHVEETVEVRGRKLYRQLWQVKDRQPRALVVFSHGLNSYGGFVAPYVHTMCTKHGFAVLAVDHHSFGRSDGLHAHVPSTLELASDLDVHVRNVAARPQFRGVPVYLLGSSMGGQIVLRYAAELDLAPQVRGLVCWAPALSIAPERKQPWIVLAIARILKFLWPAMPLVPMRPPGEGVFHTLETELAERSHPLAYRGSLRASTGMAIFDGITELWKHLYRISIPILIQHGDKDIIVDIEGSRRAIREVASKDKQLIEYPNGVHVLCRQDDINVVDDACRWIERHL